jgi:hypothetical protein
MTAEFFSGIGAQDRTFGPDSSVSAVMAQSGANPVAQFVGSFRYTISPGAGGINLSHTNTISFRSLTYDIGSQWGRHTQYPGAGVPMGNTYQTYNIFAPCKAGC